MKVFLKVKQVKNTLKMLATNVSILTKKIVPLGIILFELSRNMFARYNCTPLVLNVTKTAWSF